MVDAVLGAKVLEPIRSAAARCHDNALGVNAQRPLGSFGDDASARAILNDKIAAVGVEHDLYASVNEVPLDSPIDFLGFLGSEVPDGAVDEFKPSLDRSQANLTYRFRRIDPLDVLIGTKRKIDAIDFVDGLLGKVAPNELGKIAAHLVRERQLSIRECAGPRKPRGDAARAALNAAACTRFGA